LGLLFEIVAATDTFKQITLAQQQRHFELKHQTLNTTKELFFLTHHQ